MPAEVKYSDSTLTVTAHVDPTQQGEVDGFTYHRSLDCIKISAASPDARFIQFVTRQYPSMFDYQEYGTFSWEKVARQSQYMTDASNPKWKLDITENSQSCFYDEGGLNKTENSSKHIYDDPSGAYTVEHERAVFCTFVTINNKITHLVQWSLEHTAESKESGTERSYSVKVEAWDNKPLPLWAVNIVAQHYQSKGSIVPQHIASVELISKANSTSAEQIAEESRSHFLQAPPNWLTRVEFSTQFPAEFPEPVAPRSSLVGDGIQTRAQALSQEFGLTENAPLLPRHTSQATDQQPPGGTCMDLMRKCCKSFFKSETEEAAPPAGQATSTDRANRSDTHTNKI